MLDPVKQAIDVLASLASEYGVDFCTTTEEMGAENPGFASGEMIFPKKERLILHNVPPFLISGGEWAFLRLHESEIIAHLWRSPGEREAIAEANGHAPRL